MAQRKFPFLPVMTGLFLALAAYVVFVEIPRDQREANPDAVLLLPDFDPNLVTRIQFATHDDSGYTLEKETNGQWVFTAPRPWRAEQSVLWPLLDDLASVEILQSLKNMDPKLDQYGLAPPQGALVLETAGEKRWHISFGEESTLQLGKEASARSYVLVDGLPPVHLAETFKLNRLRKPRDDFRYRKILDLELGSLREIETGYKGRILKLVRENDAWLVDDHGLRKTVDPQKFLPLLRELFEFEVSDFVSENASAAQYGIHPAPGGSYIKLDDSHGVRVLSFGKTDEGKIYCSFVPYGEIWSVLEDRFNRLDMKPEDFLPEASTNARAEHEGAQIPVP